MESYQPTSRHPIADVFRLTALELDRATFASRGTLKQPPGANILVNNPGLRELDSFLC